MKIKLSELNKNELKEIEKRLLERKEAEIIVENYLDILYNLEKLYIFLKKKKKLKETQKEIQETINILFEE